MAKAPHATVTKLDLCLKEDQELVLSWIDNGDIDAVFAAPPCGTASAARSIEIPDDPFAPQPLRSILHPNGLPSLEGVDKTRVEQANMLYEFLQVVWDRCVAAGIPIMVENPAKSLFWLTTYWCERACPCDFIQDHHACFYGSKRPKLTRLAASFPQVHAIDGRCPGNHYHEPWGQIQLGNKRVFATSLEVHYPAKLCDAIIDSFIAFLLTEGFYFQMKLPVNAAAHELAGAQVPSNKLPPVVPEFASKLAAIFDANDKQVWPIQPLTLPPEHKLLRNFNLGGDGVQHLDIVKACKSFLEGVGLDVCLNDFVQVGTPTACLKIFGVYWTPKEFVEFAREVSHPLSPECVLPDILLGAVNLNSSSNPGEIAGRRTAFVKHWTDRATALHCEEQRLRAKMDPWVNTATRGKRILVFKEMLRACDFPDPNVCDELEHGVDLIGSVPRTGMLPGKYKPALCTKEALCQHAARMRPALNSQALGSGDDSIDETVWRKTLEEVENNWLLGPLNSDQVPRSAPISRRFGLSQKGGKVRLIDDYSESNVNSCVNTSESPILHTVDIACAMFAMWFEACKRHGRDLPLAVRTFDLKSAYRQVGLSAEGRDFAFLKVYNPKQRRFDLFQSTVLPFGAVRSVHSFLRLSRAIWWIGVVGMGLMWTSFYDDFICATPEYLAINAEQSSVALFKLTGWLFAEEGDKCRPFGHSCEALGVVFNVSNALTGSICIQNTERRVAELVADLLEVIQLRQLGQKQAQRLRGRMQFADAQIYGKTGRRCMRVLSSFAEGCKKVLNAKDVFFLKLFVELLQSGNPRVVSALPSNNVLIFTDACYERNARSWICGVGGVLFLPDGTARKFSLELSEQQRVLLGELEKRQIIFEAETLAAVIALKLWLRFFPGMRCFFFVDNEGAKFALVRGLSENKVVDFLTELFAKTESELQALFWVARVPSKSNVADEPSRGLPISFHIDNLTNDDQDAKLILDELAREISTWGDGLRASPI